jgi:hypothetical protein
MAEADHFQFDGKAIYAWYLPGDPTCLRYLLIDGSEVVVTFVTQSPLNLGYAPGITCLGEAVCCTVDLGGHPQFVPAEIVKWLAARNNNSMIVQVGEAMIVRREALCAQCNRKNDIGSKNCWWCAAIYPTGI